MKRRIATQTQRKCKICKVSLFFKNTVVFDEELDITHGFSSVSPSCGHMMHSSSLQIKSKVVVHGWSLLTQELYEKVAAKFSRVSPSSGHEAILQLKNEVKKHSHLKKIQNQSMLFTRRAAVRWEDCPADT